MAFNITEGKPNAVYLLIKVNNTSYEVVMPKEKQKRNRESDQVSYSNCQLYRAYGR